jgi:hypothetical protein
MIEDSNATTPPHVEVKILKRKAISLMLIREIYLSVITADFGFKTIVAKSTRYGVLFISRQYQHRHLILNAVL